VKSRILLAVGALAAAFLFIAPPAARADGFAVKGKVVDAATGLPLAGVKLQTIGSTVATQTTNLGGHFEFDGLSAGTYSIQATLPGYDNTVSEEFTVGGSFALPLALVMQRTSGSSQIRTLARTTVTAAASLQKASVTYQQVSGNTLLRQGITRTADAVRRLPAIDNTSSDTATYGDDVTLSIRGIGSLETVTLLDGHPVGLGLPGINWDISPSFGLRAVNVVYGAGGGDLYGVDAIGGVVDMQTLEPTRNQSVTFTQGWGTFDKLTSVLQATGTAANRWGYVIALGTSGSNGPVKNTVFFQPAASFDPSATDPAVVAAGQYIDSSDIANKGEMFKLRYGFGSNTHLTAVATGGYFYDNKTGNGDNDYLPMDTALANANLKLSNYTPSFAGGQVSALNPPNCPAGTFVGLGSGGNAYGFGLDGLTPDGGTTCVSPQQWANINTGYQGAGPAWQGFTLHDYQLRFDTTTGKNTININGFSNLYTHVYDRTFGLPNLLVASANDPVTGNPNCLPAAPCTLTSNPFWYNEQVSNAGVIGTDSVTWQNNELGVGAYYDNTASLFHTVGFFQPSPIAHETSIFVRDSYHPVNSPLTAYVSAYFKNASLTKSSYIDPRVAFVMESGSNDVYRMSVGWISTQPALTEVASPFSPSTVSALTLASCNALNSTGSGGNPSLKPERAGDLEFSMGHRFGADSTIQLSLYSETINQQLYTQTIPVLNFSPGFFGVTNYLDPTTSTGQQNAIASFANTVGSQCGITPTQALNLLGVDGTVNIGQGLAEGLELQGRQRLGTRFFFDYDYATNSSVPLHVPLSILQNDFTIIPGWQLPRIPLHKYDFAFDYTFGTGIEARTETYFVSSNNPKNLPNYNYTNVILSAPTGKLGTVSAIVSNVFQQYADYRGLLGHGYPLALNPAFASQEDYTPLIGNQATERFGLTFRTLELLYTIKVR
jgi:hypothetical protein